MNSSTALPINGWGGCFIFIDVTRTILVEVILCLREEICLALLHVFLS